MKPPYFSQQNGAATLVVVMVLFFVMAMMAAFASRNMVFEQRISSNYYRAGAALETAEAGAEWALGMLNGLNINEACLSDPAANSFRQRYLGINSQTRTITPVRIDGSAAADCVRTELNGWQCRCPAAAWTAPVGAPAAVANMQPSFHVIFPKPFFSNRAGIVRISSTGCTSSTLADCEGVEIARDSVVAQSVVSVDAALVSALKTPPAMPLVVKGGIALDADGIGLHNSDNGPSNGLLLLTADPVVPNLIDGRLNSIPGTPPQQAILLNDQALASATPALMFAQYFGMSAARYKSQPAMRTVSCAADCGPSLLAAYNSGVRMAWIDGPMLIATTTVLGTAADPMLIVVAGDVVIDGALQMTGLLYAQGDLAWANTTGLQALLTGALIVEGDLAVVGVVNLWYQSSVMDRMKNGMGSFVRVPGSWWN